MVSEDVDDQLFKKHTDLCSKLNLDIKAVTESWESFRNLSKNYTLEGDPLHWLGCAVFVACRKSVTPTVGSSVIEGNCVSLTSLLRYCNLNLVQFFCNIRQWSDMTNMPEEFRKKVDQLEESFSVTCNIFKEYCSIFSKLFKTPDPSELEAPKQHRNRKQKIGSRSVQCNPAKVFEFIWNLYITIRGEDSTYSNDLVQSYHLLLGICDLAFKNAFLAERKDLINPQFPDLPEDWLSSNFRTPDEAPCIIDKIMSNSGNALDAKYIEKYQCRNILSTLFKNCVLLGNEINFTGLFDVQVFESNFKCIKKAYESQLLSNGGFDERIFLAEYRRRILEKEHEAQNNWALLPESGDEISNDSPGRNHNFGTISLRGSETPLTGRKFLGPKDCQESGLQSITQNIARLQVILAGRLAQPSESLNKILQSCSSNPTTKIGDVVSRLGDKFMSSFVQNVDEQNENAKNILLFGSKLFYKLIESILEHEKTINKDISVLIQKDIFYECVFACAMEIVLYSYNSQKKFPWILTALEIESCDFVKIIELIVRTKDPFSRDTIKHLNKIEETILEALAWKSTSNLWNLIKQCEQGAPKEEEVALPRHWDHKKLAEDSGLQNVEEPGTPTQLGSPGPLSATDQFQSPIQNNVSRQLFPTAIHKTPQKVPEVDDQRNPLEECENNASPPRPKRTGGLAIFFRKFYNLAAVRMEHLCTHLNITDQELKRKIWTVFEVSIQKKAEPLLKDRHLDQLLMCAVYVIPKVLQRPQTFMDIMKCYRQQPQADSHIYRNVLLEGKTIIDKDGSAEDVPEKRGDLIEFYNSVYVVEMKDFTMKFANNSQNGDILVSPLPVPCARRNLVSPSIQIIKNVFVKPLDNPVAQNPNSKSYSYFFSRSPSKDLRDINRAINNNGLNVNGKKLLVDGDDLPNSKRIANRKVQSLLEERRSQYVSKNH